MIYIVLYVQAFMSAIMICIGDIGELIESFSAASFVFYLLSFIALLIMRLTHPKEPRAFKVYIYTCMDVHGIV